MNKLIPIFALTALSASACQKESKPADEATPPTPAPVKVAEVTIASVTMLEDCKDEPAAEEEQESQEAKRAPAEGSSLAMEMDEAKGYVEPCRQSTMQLAVTGQGDASAPLKIVQVRLLGPKGATLDVIETRGPTIWKDNGYSSWDQVVLPKTDVKAAYKLTLDDWATIEKNLGGNSYGPMLSVEADIEIGGVKKTIKSSQVTREPVEMIET